MNLNKYIEEAMEQLRCKCGDDDGERCQKVETGIDDVQDAFTEALTSFKEDVVARLEDMDIKDWEATDSDGGSRTGLAEGERLTAKEAVGYDFANQHWRKKREQLIKELTE